MSETMQNLAHRYQFQAIGIKCHSDIFGQLTGQFTP